MKTLRSLALIAVLLTQSGCFELVLLALSTTTAVASIQSIREREERERKEKEEAEAVIAEANVLE